MTARAYGLGAWQQAGGATTLSVPLPNVQPGDIAFAFVWSYDPAAANTAGPVVPDGWTTIASSVSTTETRALYAIEAASAIPSVEITAGSGMATNIWWGIGFNVRGAQWPPIVTSGWTGSTTAGDDVFVQALAATAAGQLALHFLFTETGTPLDVTLSPSFERFGICNTSTGVADTTKPQATVQAALFEWQTIAADWTPGARITYSPAPGFEINFESFSLLLEAAPLPPSLPTTPAPSLLSLRCAEEYATWLTDGTYRNRIDRVGWSEIDFSYALDDTSDASAALPDEASLLRCCAKLGALRPWRYGLLIERNDQEVWSGPITGMGRDPRTGVLNVRASDTMARLSVNAATWESSPRVFTNVDAGQVFAAIINTTSVVPADRWQILAPDFFVNHAFTRTIAPRKLEYAGTIIQELLDSGVDAWMRSGVLYCWDPQRGWVYRDFDLDPSRTRVLDGPYNAYMDFEYGLFTEDAFASLPSWDVDGFAQANYVATPTASSTESGFTTIYYAQDAAGQALDGMLFYADPNTLSRPGSDTSDSEGDSAAVYQFRADSVLANRHNPPAVLSGGSLAVGAPIDFENLRPGSVWRLDVHDACFGQLLQVGRLKRVDVSVRNGRDGTITEDIKPTIIPIGYSEGEYA